MVARILIFFQCLTALDGALADSSLPDNGRGAINLIAPFRYEDKEFLAFLIAPFYHPRNLVEEKIGEQLLEIADKKLIQLYKDENPTIDPSFFESMLKRTPLNDGRSNTIIITDAKDPTRLLAMIRFSYVTNQSPDYPAKILLPEMTLDTRAVIDEVEKRDSATESWLNQFKRESDGYEPGPTDAQHWLEIKNFASFAQNPDIDFIPVLFYLAEKFGVSTQSYLWLAEDGKIHRNTFGSRYFLIAKQSARRYYQRLGFIDLPGANLSGNNIAMTISRNNFRQKTLPTIGMRPGWEQLLSLEWILQSKLGRNSFDRLWHDRPQIIDKFRLCSRFFNP